MDLHENSHLHRCCMCVIMTSGLLAVGNDDFREVCHCVSGRLLLLRSVPFLSPGCSDTPAHTDRALYRHTRAYARQYGLPRIHTHTRSRTETHTHKPISQTVKSKVRRWTNRGTEGPRTAATTPLHDSIQGTCPVTSKHALCHQAPKNMFVMLPSEGYVFPNSQVQV